MNVLISAGADLLNNPMAIVLFVLIVGAFAILLVVQARKDSYDLRWLITDENTKQPSLHKFGQLVALVISSWGFVYQAVHDHLTEWYFTAYMVAWAAAEVANRYISAKNESAPDPTAPAMPSPPSINTPTAPGDGTQQ